VKYESNSYILYKYGLRDSKELQIAYQYIREPLRIEDIDRLCYACETLIIWTLINTGLSISELCRHNSTKYSLEWEGPSYKWQRRPHGRKKVKEESYHHVFVHSNWCISI